MFPSGHDFGHCWGTFLILLAQVRVISKGTYAKLQDGFRYLPDDAKLGSANYTCRKMNNILPDEIGC